MNNSDATEHSSESIDGASNEKTSANVREGGAEARTDHKASDALFANKAKEIVKARKEEKRKEKSTLSKASQKSDSGKGTEKKANEVNEYLNEYDAHVTKGGDWKFKKQHQNWILKNLYNHPWENDGLLYQYLKTIEGQARDRLLAGAMAVTEASEGKFEEDALRRAQAILKL